MIPFQHLFPRRCAGLAFLSVCISVAPAASFLPSTPADRAARAEGVVRAVLEFQHGVKPGKTVMTRYVFRTVEVLKGSFPAHFEAHGPGGEWGDLIHDDSRRLKLSNEKEYVLFVVEQGGRMMPIDGPGGAVPSEDLGLPTLRNAIEDMPDGADFSPFEVEPMSFSFAVTGSGLLESGGVRRFTEGDREEAIPVVADISTRPAGISQAEALTALDNALAAWETETSLVFRFEGTEVFPQSADEYSSADGLVVRVQFHDNYNKISDTSNTLGVGGAGYSGEAGTGGVVDGTSFRAIRYGFVILNHPKSSLEDATTLEEVLSHELGHVLGLAHSSETASESDPILADAQMYYLVHADGRGADLRQWDIDTLVQAYPANTPPYSYNRHFLAVTIPPGTSLSNPGVNQVTAEGFDRNGDSLSFSVSSSSNNNGSFSYSEDTVTYTPSGYFGDADVSDPAEFFYDQLVGTFSDGVNESPPVEVRIIGFRSDSRPVGAPDGVPDSYMTTYYGSADGSTAGADTDTDGFTTLEEFLMQTDPTDPDSGLILTGIGDGSLTWTGRRFDLFRIQTREDLTTGDWVTRRLATKTEDAATVTWEDIPTANSGGVLFYRVQRVD